MIFATVAVLVHLTYEVNSAPAVIQNICVYQNGVAHHKWVSCHQVPSMAKHAQTTVAITFNGASNKVNCTERP